MRPTLARILVILATVIASVAVTVPAQASADVQQVVYLTRIKQGTNVPCAQGFDKMFVVSMRVPRGETIHTFDAFQLRLKSGRTLYDFGYQVRGRLVEYYFFPPSRKARVDRDKGLSFTWTELSEGARARAVVAAHCMSRVP